METCKVLKPKEFAELINVKTVTLKRWHESGKFPARISPSGRRFYTTEDLDRYYRGFGKEV